MGRAQSVKEWRAGTETGPSPLQRGAQELGLVLIGLCLYLVVRTVTEGGRVEAYTNAATLRRLEAGMGLAWEASLQSAVGAHGLLHTYFNYVYLYGYWPVLGLALISLFLVDRTRYQRLRNALLVSGAVGLLIFAVFPVAPPRLSDPAIVDTIAAVSGGPALARPASLVNEFAALPSFHVGWILLVSIMAAGACRGRLARGLFALLPVQMAIAVIVTGNHFVIDVVVGCVVVIVALAISVRMTAVAPAERRSESPPQPAV